MSPLSQVQAPPLCPAAHPLLLGGGGAGEDEPRRPLSVPSSQDLSHLPSSWALPFGAPAWGWHPRLEKRTQGSLFQPRRQRAPLSTPGPSPHWVSVCEGVEPVQRGGRGGRTTEDRSPRTAPGATFAASSACPEPAPRLTRLSRQPGQAESTAGLESQPSSSSSTCKPKALTPSG
ncbi:unnamed protein product [Rangifer tarandus platyrhynchus]|uniref:Uncharacterized protein n=1 Tax=Rangifer tarandus platyrhynchus TaxID=3082113 RepID=A0AC59Y0B8_RANTA